LSGREAAIRLERDGLNALQEGKGAGPMEIFLGQFKSLMIWVLLAAGLLSATLGDTIDAAAIIAIVLLNALSGFYQEFSAQKSIAALHKIMAPRAKIRREGRVCYVPSREIVVGDILVLEAGDLIAADARLIWAASLKCLEAALTGEAEAVNKSEAVPDNPQTALGDQTNMLYLGTSVVEGNGEGVVVATGMDTEVGRIAELMQAVTQPEQTPLQRQLDAFGRVFVWATLAIVGVLCALGVVRNTPLLEMFMVSVSLAVAAIPEGLPAIVTVALSLGVLRMSRRNALVRTLGSVETLGAVSVICTDKTGTLTRGEMAVQTICVAGKIFTLTGEEYAPRGEGGFQGKKAGEAHRHSLNAWVEVILGCNNSSLVEEAGGTKFLGDPTECALLAAGIKAGGELNRFEKEQPRVRLLPFDFARKRSSVVRSLEDGRLRAFAKGAPGELLECCSSLFTEGGIVPLTQEDRLALREQISAMAHQGLRVLGAAFRDLGEAAPETLTATEVERGLTFVGLAGIVDPARAEVKGAIAKCRAAGIRVVMITGDHPSTALALARDIGLAMEGDEVLTGLALDALSECDLGERTPHVAVFARVTPEHKLRIINAWRALGAVVAMTGDGVNDSPALKGADVGIAMGKTGTEVAKQAADMIITDDDFSTIVAAVEEGRGIYENIRKALHYLLAGNAGELLLFAACILAGMPSPLMPVHLLWINLVTDGLPALCLATDRVSPELMQRAPRRVADPLMDRGFLVTMSVTSALTGGVAFVVFVAFLKFEGLEQARSNTFAVLVFAELLRAFGARSEILPIWRPPFFSNLKLVVAVLICFGLQFWIHQNATLRQWFKTEPVSLAHGLMLLALGSIPLLALEGVKVFGASKRKNRGQEIRRA